ncbi:MAG: ribosome maturation factor RimP [Oscillospiraceae bacterium]|nr:ribosome maturation factor RimP [Oscillospiraceae bacterium]
MSKIVDAVASLAEPIVTKNGCELWDVEYVKDPGGWVLRIFIDHPEGVMISHCEAISRELDPILDEHEEMIPTSYTFEVSSAGAERQLKRPSDFERFLNHMVEVKLYKAKDGKKVFLGSLVGYSKEQGVEIDVEGQRYAFEKPEVANVRLRIG